MGFYYCGSPLQCHTLDKAFTVYMCPCDDVNKLLNKSLKYPDCDNICYDSYYDVGMAYKPSAIITIINGHINIEEFS